MSAHSTSRSINSKTRSINNPAYLTDNASSAKWTRRVSVETYPNRLSMLSAYTQEETEQIIKNAIDAGAAEQMREHNLSAAQAANIIHDLAFLDIHDVDDEDDYDDPWDDFGDNDEDDDFDPAPAECDWSPSSRNRRAPLRSERREKEAIDAALGSRLPALSPAEILSLHAEKAHSPGSYPVCPPEWDMTPNQYETATWRAASGSFDLFQTIMLLCVLMSTVGFAVIGASLMGWTHSTSGSIGPLILFGAIDVAVGSKMAYERAQKNKAGRQLEALDPRQTVVLTDPEHVVTMRGAAAVLDKNGASLADGARWTVLKQMYETAQKFAADETSEDANSRQGEAGDHHTVAAEFGLESEVAERRRRWTQALARFEVVDDAWADLLTDPIAVLEHARLLDVKNEATATFIEAHGHARDLIGSRSRETTDADLPPMTTVRELETAVRALATAWADAQVRAKRAGYDWMPEEDLKRARRATGLLAQAADEGVDWGLRVNLTEQALKLMRAIEVVPVPEQVLGELAAKAAPAIEASDNILTASPTTPAAPILSPAPEPAVEKR